jgi:hypothetical protein
MKNLGIRGVVLLVLVLGVAVPVFASPPTGASGYGWLTGLEVGPDGGLIAVAQWDGTFVGELKHPLGGGRAVRAEFVGSVGGREGTLDMLILKVWGDPTTPGYHGKWVILGGDGELQSLRGQGAFTFDSYNPAPAGPYEGQIHFDPQ